MDLEALLYGSMPASGYATGDSGSREIVQRVATRSDRWPSMALPAVLAMFVPGLKHGRAPRTADGRIPGIDAA